MNQTTAVSNPPDFIEHSDEFTIFPTRAASLVLYDGTVLKGQAIGADKPITTGRIVFEPTMLAYQETLFDHTKSGQIISFSYPHIGNYGITDQAPDPSQVVVAGIVARNIVRRGSNPKFVTDLETFMIKANISGIAGVDTRLLSRRLRDNGPMIASFGTAEIDELVRSVDEHALAEGAN